MSEEREQSLGEMEAAYADFVALLESPGWQRFRRLQESQVKVIDFELRKPLVTLEAAISDQFYKGESSGMIRLCALAESIPEILLRDIQRLRQEGTQDGTGTQSDTDAERAARFRAYRLGE